MDKETGNIYKIEVPKLGVVEYYEYEQNLGCDEVKERWMDHATSKFGLGLLAVKGDISVKQIAENEVHGEIKDGR